MYRQRNVKRNVMPKKDSFCGRENLLIFIRSNDLEDWARRRSDHSAEFVGFKMEIHILDSRNLFLYF